MWLLEDLSNTHFIIVRIWNDVIIKWELIHHFKMEFDRRIASFSQDPRSSRLDEKDYLRLNMTKLFSSSQE